MRGRADVRSARPILTIVRRSLIPSVLCVSGGLIAGVYAGVYLLNFQPAVVGWLFGAGAGISGGAFVAAMATNTALVGSGGAPRRRGVVVFGDDDDADDLGDAEYAEPPGRNGH